MNYHVVSNPTSEGLSKAYLDEHYSNEDVGFMIICENAAKIYVKTETSWVDIPTGTVA